MSLNKYKKLLKIDLKPSNLLLFFIIFIHILAFSVLILSLDIPFLIKILISICIIFSLYLILKKNNSIKFYSFITQIRSCQDLDWILINKNEKQYDTQLQKNWFSLPWLLILYFKSDNSNQTIIILPDMISKNDLRDLKLYLSLIKP